MTKEEIIQNSIDTFEALGNALADAIDAEIYAELSKEERKTAIQNNALKERLNNENLSAKQREDINNKIADNEAKLQKKRDELALKAFKLQKAVSIGQTLINTYEMATKAYNALANIPFVGPALGTAAATAATLFGLAQVNAIRKTQFVPSGIAVNSRAGSASAGGSSVNAPDFNIVGQSTSNQVAQAVQGQLQKPVKAYVVSKDVTTAQEMDRNIVSTATL